MAFAAQPWAETHKDPNRAAVQAAHRSDPAELAAAESDSLANTWVAGGIGGA